MGKMSKNKGKVGEREVAALLRKFGFEARRGVQYQGGEGAPDVKHNIPGVHIEVKRTEQFPLWAAMDQAKEDGFLQDAPVVFHRKNGKPWVAVLYAEDFLYFMKELNDAN